MGGRARLAIVVSVLTGILLIAGAGLAVLEPNRAVLLLLVAGVLAAMWAGLGVLVGRRQGGAGVGLLLSLVGLAWASTVVKEIGWQVLARRPETLSNLDWLVAAMNESTFWVLTAVGLLLLHFPDGRVPSSRWRWVPLVMIVCTALQQLQGAFPTEPFRSPLTTLAPPFGPPPAWLEDLGGLAFVTLLGLVLACSASLILRFRRSDRIRRAQIKWLVLVGVGVPLYPFLCLAEILIWGSPQWFSVTVAIISVVGIPVATTVAMLRHDLYDVDKAVAGTVTWALVTIVLVAIYGLSASAAGIVLSRDSAAAAAGATGICAVAFLPLRVKLQRGVDGRLYPLRRAAFSAIDALHRDTSTGKARPEELQSVLQTALREPALRVGYQIPGTEGFVDSAGATVDSRDGVMVVLGGGPIGVLLAGNDGASLELLRQVAARSTTLVEVVRLRLEVAQALREVESSRTRLVQIGFEERRRLERDLHDGAQQRLVSLGMALRLAQRHLDDNTVDVDGLLDQSVAELGIAVGELRQIAQGLRPGALDDGLRAALAALTRTVPVTVELDVCADALPDDVATTAYYVVSEAVANAVKHANASCIRLRVSRANHHVLVRIADDGRGGARLRASSGLADRVAALKGTLRVESPAGRGTVIEAALPCES